MRKPLEMYIALFMQNMVQNRCQNGCIMTQLLLQKVKIFLNLSLNLDLVNLGVHFSFFPDLRDYLFIYLFIVIAPEIIIKICLFIYLLLLRRKL